MSLSLQLKNRNSRRFMNVDEAKLAHYRANADCPYHPCGFRGTFAFSDHSLIPETYREFLLLSFGVNKISRVSLDRINELMNREWDREAESPMEHIHRLTVQLRNSSRDIKFDRGAVTQDDSDHSLPVFGWAETPFSDSNSTEED